MIKNMFKIARISPSIIATNYKDETELKKTLKLLEDSTASMVHLDVMDGKFVKNKTFDHKLVEFCKQNCNLLLDVHLMIENPEKYVDDYINAGADILTVHYESTNDIKSLLQSIKSKNVIAGVSIKPSTSVSVLKELLDNKLADLVLIMSVEPGKYGQEFIAGSGEKVAELREMDKEVTIEVDGGVNLKNAAMLRRMGANILVSGATIFNSSNIKKTIKLLGGKCFFLKKK